MAISFLYEKDPSVTLDKRLTADGTSKKHSRSAIVKKRYFATYPKVINFFLKNYATDEVISETEYDITRFARPSHMTKSQYAIKLMTQKFWSVGLYVEYARNEIFIKVLDAPIRHIMRDY